MPVGQDADEDATLVTWRLVVIACFTASF